MTSTIYVDYTPPAVDAAWLNDTNNFVYSDTGGARRSVTTLTALRTVLKASALWVDVLNEGLYWQDVADTTSADNNRSVIVAADGARWHLVTSIPTKAAIYGTGSNAPLNTGIIVPFYYYPSNGYSDPLLLNVLEIRAKFPNVPMMVIINPSSGPGIVTDGNIAAMIQLFRGVGISVLGYVDSNYTAVTLAALEAQIALYGTLYGTLDGIFVDNMHSTTPTTDVPYYSAVTSYCHNNGLPICICNPGTAPSTNAYFTAADILMIQENPGYPTYNALITQNYYTGSMGIGINPKQKAAVAYQVPFSIPDIMILQQAAQWVYVTDMSSANPYNGLPTYFDELVEYCSNTVTHTGGIQANALQVPVNLTPTAGTGTLAAGTYAYRVAARSNAGSTLASNETSLTLTATGGVRVNWQFEPGAVSYDVFGRTAGAELFLANILQGTLTFLDNGSITPTTAMPTADTSAQSTFGGGVSVAGGVSITGGSLTGSHGSGSVSTNTVLGTNALAVNTTGGGNTASGVSALAANTTGAQNTASGQDALAANTQGSNNTASGQGALAGNTMGYNNTASGQGALSGNTTGHDNTVLGFNSAAGITTGAGNTILGANVTIVSAALTNNIIIANGTGAKMAQHDGSNWTLSGRVAIGNAVNTNEAVALGQAQADFAALTGNASQVFSVASAVNSNEAVPLGQLQNDSLSVSFTSGTFSGGVSITKGSLTGSYGAGNVTTNLALGSGALASNTAGSNNTATGTSSLANNTTGNYNTASGINSLTANTTGSSNTASGVSSLISNTSGNYNTASGINALAGNTTGSNNTATGASSLTNNTTGSENVAVGLAALAFNTIGVQNTGLGYGSLYDVTTSSNNTAVGYNTGGGITTGVGNTVLGANVTGLASALTNNIIVANGSGIIKAQHDGTNWTLVGVVTSSHYTVATLPTASTLPYGRSMVSDASSPTFGAVVAGGGTTIIPVYSDGTNWRVG